MDMAYMGKLLISVAIFAPGLILLTVLLFVGLLMAIERFGAAAKSATKAEAASQAAETGAANPEPGSITAALKESLAAEAKEKEDTGSATGS